MTVRFNEGHLALDISVRPGTLSFALISAGEVRIRVSIHKDDPRSTASKEILRLASDLRREGCRRLASRVEQSYTISRQRWYDPNSGFDQLHDDFLFGFKDLQWATSGATYDQLAAKKIYSVTETQW